MHPKYFRSLFIACFYTRQFYRWSH